KKLLNPYNKTDNIYFPINAGWCQYFKIMFYGYFSFEINNALQEKLWGNTHFQNLPISQLYSELFDILKKGHPDGGIIIQNKEQLKLSLNYSGRLITISIEEKQTLREFCTSKQINL